MLEPGVIELTVRNDGPDAVSVAQAVVNDAFVQFTGAEEPIGRLETATVRIAAAVGGGRGLRGRAASPRPAGRSRTRSRSRSRRPPPTPAFFGLMALLGIYVGVIPVALGMLWLPWLRRIPPGWLRGVMALTIGLLAFLAVDATLEGFELAGEGSQAFGGAALVFVGAGVAYLLLSGVSAWLTARRRAAARAALGHDARAAGRDRHRPAQPRRGRGDRRRLLRRRAGARRVPGGRLRDPQHHRGPRDRRADRPRARRRWRSWPCSG